MPPCESASYGKCNISCIGVKVGNFMEKTVKKIQNDLEQFKPLVPNTIIKEGHQHRICQVSELLHLDYHRLVSRF